MSSAERPYMQLKKPELLAMKAEALQDPTMRQQLVKELSFRSQPWAQDFLIELLAPGESAPSGQPKHARHGKPEPAVGAEFNLLALRQTFTAEAEYLSRWGVTPLLPLSMRTKVKEMWRKELKSSEDAHGRSLEQLERDFSAAESEAALIVALDPRSRHKQIDGGAE